MVTYIVIYHSLLSGASRPTVLTSATGACVFALDTNNDLHYFIKVISQQVHVQAGTEYAVKGGGGGGGTFTMISLE